MVTISESRSFNANLDSLSPIREFITDSGKSIGLDKNRIYQLCLAVDEIATNIINYGYAESGIVHGSIDITLHSDDKVLSVILEDMAVPFNPFEINIPGDKELSLPLDERPIGGLGIMLAKESVDVFRYEYKNGKNRNIFCINIR